MLDESYWDNRYKTNATGWDLGVVSPPLKSYFDQLQNKKLKILIPGGGNSYEAEYLFANGFNNVYVIDISKTVIENFKKRVPDFPTSNLIHKNFFDLDITFDLIIEQTFFCALHPSLRKDYVIKMRSLLRPGAKLVGLLFNVPLNDDHPPFGGSKEEYRSLFQNDFEILTIEPSYNSIGPRLGKELFIQFLKQTNVK